VSAATRLAALPRNTRRVVALALLVMVIVLAWLLVWLPVSTLASSQDEWRRQTAQQIAKDRGLAKSAARVREVAQSLRDAPIRARLYEAGDVPVDDQLQNDLRAALVQSGVEPTTFKVLPGATTQGLRQHRVEFSSVLSVDQLRSLLTALEQQRHYVRVERLRVEAPAEQRSNENPHLTLLMEAKGYSLDVSEARVATRVARAY
jgi:hypothetical protein